MTIGFESLLPSVYFERITLDTSNRAEYTETNPHIDHEREPKFIVDVRTGEIKPEVLTINLTRKKDNSEYLIVKLDLMAKEKLDNSAVSTWFDEQDILKYLKVRVLQVSDGDITSKLANGIYTVFSESLYDKKDVIIRSVFLRDIKKESLDNYDFEFDNDGNRVYNIPFSIDYQITNLNPNHLSYFAVAYLDVEDMAKDYDMDLPPGNIKAVMGRVASEVIIKEVNTAQQSSTGVGTDTIPTATSVKVVSESYVFLTEQGQVWDGPLHVANGKWMSGIEGDPEAKLLTVHTIVNSKIQDFRDRKEIEKLENDFSVIENEFLGNRNLKILTNANMNITRKVNYFSNFNIARDSEGQSRFLFGVDFLRMAKEQTVYGNFYRNDDTELLNHIKIKSFKVFRIRVSSTKDTLVNNDGYAPFDKDTDIPELVAFSNEKEVGQLIKNEYIIKKEDSRGKKIGIIREVKIEVGRQLGIRHFTGVDYEMKDVTFGHYKYLIEMEMEDKTSDFIEQKVGDLIEAYNVLKNYYDEASSPKHYDVHFNRFKSDYATQVENFYSNDVSKAPWIFSISTFLAVLDTLYPNVDVKKYSNSLYLFTHPKSGSPDSILMVLKTIDVFVNRLSNLVGIKLSGSSTKWDTGVTQRAFGPNIIKSKTPLKLFAVKSFSEETFDSDVPKKVGYDYLSDGELELESNDDGLKVVSFVKFEDRTNTETLKYFKDTKTDINIRTDFKVYTDDDKLENNKYSFLTPSNVNFGNQISLPLVRQGAALYEQERFAPLMTQITKFNIARKSPQITLTPMKASVLTNTIESQRQTTTNLSQIFSEKSVSTVVRSAAQASSQPAIASSIMPTSNLEYKATPLTPVREVAGSGSLINNEDPKIEEFSKGTLSNFVDKSVSTEVALLPLMNFVNNNVDSNVNSSINSSLIKKNTSNLLNSLNILNPSNIIDKAAIPYIQRITPSLKTTLKKPSEFDKLKLNTGGQTLSLKTSNPAGLYVKSLPNQIKSLIMDNLSSAGKLVKSWSSQNNELSMKSYKVKPDDSLPFQMAYKNIRQIEVLIGYDVGREGRQIKKQKWEKLTAEIFKKSVGKNLLCRMVPFQDKMLGVSVSKGQELPCYNEYFILSPEEKMAEIVEIQGIDKQKQLSGIMVATDLGITNLFNKAFAKTTSLPMIQRNSITNPTVLQKDIVNPLVPLNVKFNVNVGEMRASFETDIASVNKIITTSLNTLAQKSEIKRVSSTTIGISPVTGFKIKTKL